MESIFTEIRTYVDENKVIHISGYKTDDDNEEGIIIGFVIKGSVYWKRSEFQFDPYVKKILQEAIEIQNKEAELLRDKVTKAITEVYYTLDAKPRPEFTAGNAKDKVSLIKSGANDIMKLL